MGLHSNPEAHMTHMKDMVRSPCQLLQANATSTTGLISHYLSTFKHMSAGPVDFEDSAAHVWEEAAEGRG
jgi:hypothetical protein